MMDKKLQQLRAKVQSANEQWLAEAWDNLKRTYRDHPGKAEPIRMAIMRELHHKPFTEAGELGWFLGMKASLVQIGMAYLQEKLMEWEEAGEIKLLGDGEGVTLYEDKDE